MSTPGAGQSISSMSDADFLSVDPSNYPDFTYTEDTSDNVDSEIEESTNDTASEEPVTEQITDEVPSDELDQDESDQDVPVDNVEDGDDETAPVDDSTDDDGLDTDTEGSDSGDDDGDTDSDSSETTELTPAELLAQIMAPFKASGAEFEVRTPEEVRSLMQKGVDYQKKMQGIAPHMRTVRTLAAENITPEELNYMIDLRNKVPAAISKLMQDSGIDPHDLDSESAQDYQATNHQVSDSSMRLTDVLEELRDTTTYPRFISEVGKAWDQDSRDTMGQKPVVMKWINDQMASGIYDIVASEVARERTFGKLDGLTDLQAYQQVGEALNSQGKFNHLTTPPASGTQGQRVTPEDKPLPPKQVAKDDPKRKAARKAAGTVAQKPSTQGAQLSEYDIGKLSDKEFMAQLGSKLA